MILNCLKDISSNLSRNTDDDSSSIVSGLTNLYLDRTRNIDVAHSFISPSNQTNFYSFYQNDNNVRSRSQITSKWTQAQSQMSKNYKKEINLFY